MALCELKESVCFNKQYSLSPDDRIVIVVTLCGILDQVQNLISGLSQTRSKANPSVILFALTDKCQWKQSHLGLSQYFSWEQWSADQRWKAPQEIYTSKWGLAAECPPPGQPFTPWLYSCYTLSVWDLTRLLSEATSQCHFDTSNNSLNATVYSVMNHVAAALCDKKRATNSCKFFQIQYIINISTSHNVQIQMGRLPQHCDIWAVSVRCLRSRSLLETFNFW